MENREMKTTFILFIMELEFWELLKNEAWMPGQLAVTSITL